MAAIVGQKVSALAESPPSVQIVANASTRRPFGLGSGRLGMQLWTGFAKCYGPDDPTGAILCMQLAGVVADAVDGRGGYRGSTFLVRTYAPDIESITRDPDVHWPYATVRLEIYAARQAVP